MVRNLLKKKSNSQTLKNAPKGGPVDICVGVTANTMAADAVTEQYAEAMNEAISAATTAEEERDTARAETARLHEEMEHLKTLLRTTSEELLVCVGDGPVPCGLMTAVVEALSN